MDTVAWKFSGFSLHYETDTQQMFRKIYDFSTSLHSKFATRIDRTKNWASQTSNQNRNWRIIITRRSKLFSRVTSENRFWSWMGLPPTIWNPAHTLESFSTRKSMGMAWYNSKDFFLAAETFTKKIYWTQEMGISFIPFNFKTEHEQPAPFQ